MPEIDRTGVIEQLLEAGDELPESTEDAIVARGAEVVPALIGLLESDELAEEDAPGEGSGPLHAAQLLARIGAPEAIEPLLRVLARCDPMELRYDVLLDAARTFGAAALEPALAAHAAAKDSVPFARILLATGVREPRVLAALLRTLEEVPELGAGMLADYGDPAALPSLGAALDRATLDDGQGFLGNQHIFELASAIEDLGGALDEPQARKRAEVRKRRAAFDDLLIAGDAPAEPTAPARRHADARKKKLRKQRKRAQRRNRR